MVKAAKISVIIPVYNAAQYIAQAIQSVLDQTYKVHEIIVVDDGSTDNSSAIIQQFSDVIYLFKENSGVSATLNLGVRNISGDFIAFLDADDYWAIDKIEKQMLEFNKDSNLELVFGHHKCFYSKNAEELSQDELINSQLTLPAFFKGALLAKKESFFKVGLFDETIVMGDFLDWYRRALDINVCIKMIPDIVLFRRIHGENMSIRNQAKISDFVKIMKASMDRRRLLE